MVLGAISGERPGGMALGGIVKRKHSDWRGLKRPLLDDLAVISGSFKRAN